MNTYKAYKLRIYPTDSQRELIEKTFGCTRYIYNNFLVERKNKYEESKIFISDSVCCWSRRLPERGNAGKEFRK